MQYITYAIYKHQHPRATADQDSAMGDSAEGPSAMKKQKIEDGGSLRKWSGAAISYSTCI